MNRVGRAAPCVAALLFATAPARAQADKPALGGLDPVALCGGESLPGRAELTAHRPRARVQPR